MVEVVRFSGKKQQLSCEDNESITFATLLIDDDYYY